ncbi:cupin domain-containing protein [Ruicaihuangia caeni]|uniref:Cupin domain-containing protein n=1 Tax=Ruicaihuangia caeni TaxID=3042517 RepID=A0AAW6TAZ0_9MICO|nr:cupin domain-containing protein [Klugiella sp. YN-L-19]MDI2099619.1 cupin domain-containing protein [Klugiella sp. YN-L-19]
MAIRRERHKHMQDIDIATLAPLVRRPDPTGSDTEQTEGLLRLEGVGPRTTPAKKLFFQTAINEPGTRSLPHHHGEAETAGYVAEGHGRIYYGEGYSLYVDMLPGDFAWIPPYMPHIEANMSPTERLVWMTARTPDNIVVNLDDVDDSTLEGFERA